MSIFDTKIDRKNSASIKWDRMQQEFSREDVIPLWIADMDFASPIAIQEALLERVKHGVYGYTYTTQPVLDSIVNWYYTRHNVEILSSSLVLTPNVLSAYTILLHVLSKEKDSIIMFSPAYTPFFKIASSLNRKPVLSKMKLVDNRYEMDFIEFEKLILQHQPKILVLCNPHNPGNRVWEISELKTLLSICEKYQIEIISDDIHSDLIYPTHSYTPLFKLATTYKDHIHTISAPTKSFNLAGIGAAYTIFFNTHIKRLFVKFISDHKYTAPSAFSLIALESAYTSCSPWLDALNEYICENIKELTTQLHTTNFKVIQGEGTYLAWIDYSQYAISEKKMYDILLDHELGIMMGSHFGDHGEGFFRMNIGTQKERITWITSKLIDVHNLLSIKAIEDSMQL